MNNIRVSIDLTKVDGARAIRAQAPSGKQEYYIAIPASSLFLPKDSKSAFLTCTMIPCPNALYGDFMLKKYIDGRTYANMSAEEHKAVPIIGKGTYIVPKLDKEQAASYERTDVESVTLDDMRESSGESSDAQSDPQEGHAPNSNAPFPAESGTPTDTKLYVVDEDNLWWECVSWDQAKTFAESKNPDKCSIKLFKGGKMNKEYHWDAFLQQWIATADPKTASGIASSC